MADQKVELRNSINNFSRDFYQAVAASKPSESTIMSPLSAEIALAMLSMGAQGETMTELHRSLYLPGLEFTKSAFRDAMSDLNSLNSENVMLKIANKVYVKQGPQFELDSQYKDNVVSVFKSEIQSMNFVEKEQSANTINKWVEDKTNEKIKDLVKADSFSDDTRLVLVNAIYFKGAWEKKFEAARTFKQDFYITPENKVQVDMMHKTGKFRYAEIHDWDAKVLELPYSGQKLAMVIILPNKLDGLADLEKKLADKSIDTAQVIENALHEVEVDISLPKFRIETEMDLKQILPKVGIKRIFTGAAELGGLLKNDEPLYVSEAIQKAFIEVNEEGAEAAAATELRVMVKKCARPHKQKFLFKADHPFMFCLRDNEKNMCFIGQFTSQS